MNIVIGSRGSALAVWQAEHVQARLTELGHTVEIRRITTTGDRLLDKRLESVGGKGAFLKEIEEALLAREVDLAVHSLKDVPTALPGGLRLCGFLKRADPRDGLLSAGGVRLDDLPKGARIGTTSLRRRAQLLALRPDFRIEDLRGNVDTRIRRLKAGDFDAILLAMAGLRRLGWEAEVTEVLEPERLLPAPGQGAIALECRAEDTAVASAVMPIHHEETERRITAERAFLAALGGGCNVPLGAYAEGDNRVLTLRALVASVDGRTVLREEARGGDAVALGREVAERLMVRGAAALLHP